MKIKRLLFWSLITILLLGTIGILVPILRASSSQPARGIPLDAAKPVEAFSLIDTTGHPISWQTLHKDKYTLLFFGYTSCPDVCPTTLADLSQAMTALGEDANHVQVVMISVDPDIDTPEKLAPYMQAFHPDFIGLTGSVEEIRAIATQFGVYFEKHHDEGMKMDHSDGHTEHTNNQEAQTSSLVDHSTAVTFIDPDGYVRMLFPTGSSGAEMAADVQLLLR